ncbi:hypothetical protein J5N97_018422 [Dioscorea zingiberensis]|uniref:Fibronectin type III-like domain-containing protein n=1 Tax=Dioscorea zingiberensis TaxID=325984 RepID=A0A9D5HHL9_9LILI|nr:hypothetical protein J5N97_018422 [Dioscorea zingiberensis]
MGLLMDNYTYCDSSLPYSVRVKDLISRMTLREKFMNLGDQAQGVGRIGLPSYYWWSEALHGVAWVGHGTHFSDIVKSATVFPTPLLTAASFNESLWKTIGQAVSTEGRAMYNLGHAGLTFWSPNINVARDPRWGRTMETPGEDPLVAGRYSVNYVRGLQDVEGFEVAEDPNSRSLKVSACCKHFTAYDLDHWFDGMIIRQAFDAKVMEQDMVETFSRPFEMCVKEGDGSSIMCSFNDINGIPVCANPKLMYQTFRGEWDLHGYIVSDCSSLEVIHKEQKWLHDTAEDAVAQVLKAGLDLDCGYGDVHYYQSYGESAAKQGKIREGDVDNALKNLYTVLMRLGFFDGNPIYDKLGLQDICSKEHIELSKEAASQGIVLLKNNNSTLPLNPKKKMKIAMVGPHVTATTIMRANYPGISCKDISPLEAFKADAQTDYQLGCDVYCNELDLPPVINAVKNSDATVIFAGLEPENLEAEQHDRDSLALPGQQVQLINAVAEAAPGPVVLVIMSGTCVDIAFAEKNPKIGAILWAGYPGEQGGHAIADIVFGRTNPGGKLPITWYNGDYVDALPMTSMQLRPNKELGYPGRTYKFYEGPVQYPFGHGLSYTEFKYSIKSVGKKSMKARLEAHQQCKPVSYKDGVIAPECPGVAVQESRCEESIEFKVEVENVGKMDGEDVVLVYSKPPEEVDDGPIKQLVGYERVFVKAGEKKVVSFLLNACKALGLVEKTAYTVLPSGVHTIVVGNNGKDSVSFPFQVSFFH